MTALCALILAAVGAGRAGVTPAPALGVRGVAGRGTVSGIMREWTRLELPPPQQDRRGTTRWNRASILSILLNPRIAGLSVYHDEIVGQGQWEPLVSEETWRAVRGILEDPARKPPRGVRTLLGGPRQLLAIEAQRLARVPDGCDVIVEDRSVHTLLAHSYALQRMTGTAFLAPSARLLRSSPIPSWPDLVLYLDLPQTAVHDRNQSKFPPGSIYTDDAFNAAIRAYFRRLAGRKTPHVAWLDATLDLPELTRLAAARIRNITKRQDTRGAV